MCLRGMSHTVLSASCTCAPGSQSITELSAWGGKGSDSYLEARTVETLSWGHCSGQAGLLSGFTTRVVASPDPSVKLGSETELTLSKPSFPQF